VLLTRDEARILREGDWESRLVCANSYGKALMILLPSLAIGAGAILLSLGHEEGGWNFLMAGIGIGLTVLAGLLGLQKIQKGRIFRILRWVMVSAVVLGIFGKDALRLSWLLIPSVWPLAWIEWRRHTIRRKLPVAMWPKHLYL
jgi:hypothetical protein